MLELVHTSPWAWTALCLLLGLIAGGVHAGGWRLRLSNDLLGEQRRLRLLETKSEHQRLGISDLKLRIRLSQRERELLNTDLKLLRSTYAQLDTDLSAQWAGEIELKSLLVNQQGDIDRLHRELADWKTRLFKLQEQLNEGAIDEAQLKQELTLGITAVCEHNSGEMTAVQTLLHDCAGQIDEQTIELEPQKVIGLLAAKVELLEGQTNYWQDLVLANKQAELAKTTEAPLEFITAEQAKLGTIAFGAIGDSATTDSPAANSDEPSLSNARDRIAQKSKKARGPKSNKRKRKAERKALIRAKKTRAKKYPTISAEDSSSRPEDDPHAVRVVSKQA